MNTSDNTQPSRARLTAIVLGVSVVINLAFLMFAFAEKSKAAKHLEEIEKCRNEATMQRAVAEKNKIDLEVALKSLSEAMRVLEVEREKCK